MASPPPHFLLARERQRNQSTRLGFERYAEHRARVMAQLADRRGERLAVLGAGNCNDLELDALADRFSEIHLFDLDGEALHGAVSRQSSAVRAACRVHERDLTGVVGFVDAWKQHPPEPLDAQIAAWKQLSGLLGEVGEFDVVLSSCLLSQVAINLRDFFGLVPALNSALIAAVTAHVLLATALTRPGGSVLLVSDCITDRYPIREEAEQRGAVNAILHLASQGAAFPGTDPRLIADLLTLPDFSAPELVDAWIWDLSEQAYLVYALRAARLAGPGGAPTR